MICSTIIPTINRRGLERAVKSALEQDLGQELHEIIVFNNSDGLLPAADWLRSPQVTVVNTHSNLIDASNQGAAMASGKYLNFLHDDDYLLPGALKALIDVAESSSSHWVCGAYNLIDDDGDFISLVRPQTKGNVFALLVGGECLHFADSLINKEAFLKVGGLDPQIPIRCDLDLECQVALQSDFDSTDQIVANVRVSGGNGSALEWSPIAQDHRRLREKALASPIALNRIRDSVQGDVFLRGRACRAYLFSAVLNLRAGHFSIFTGRFFSFLRLASFHMLLPNFWLGLFFRTSWHAGEKM